MALSTRRICSKAYWLSPHCSRRAVGGHDKPKVAHVRVVGREQTQMFAPARQDDRLHPQILSSVSRVVEKKPECLGLRTK